MKTETPNSAEWALPCSLDAPHSRMLRIFAMAASAVAGKPMVLGAQQELTDLSEPARHPMPV